MSSKLHREQNIFPHIFSLTIEDIPQIIKIGEQSNLSRWTFKDYSDEIGRCDSISLAYKQSIDHSIKNSLPEQENILGFIVSRLIKSNSAFDKTLNSDNHQDVAECEILNIAVHPLFRKKGIGQQLFAATVERCLSENVESVWLEVRKNNDAAVKFYQRNAFEVIYTRKSYYQNPLDDALVMRASLSQASSSKFRGL